MTVQKSATETWTFSTDKDTKGTAKVGDKVTVYYKMVATEIEAKPAAPAATPAREEIDTYNCAQPERSQR